MQYEFTNMQPVAQNKLKARNMLQMLTSDLFVHHLMKERVSFSFSVDMISWNIIFTSDNKDLELVTLDAQRVVKQRRFNWSESFFLFHKMYDKINFRLLKLKRR